MKKTLKYLGGAALAFAFAGSAHAVLLSDLLQGGSITAGDKVFDEWRVIDEFYSDPAFTVDPANIDVTALNDGGTDPGPGLDFTVLNGAMDVAGDGFFAFLDYMFGFRVTSLGAPIKDNTLELSESALFDPTEDLGIGIVELVGTDPTLVEFQGDQDLAFKEVESSYLDPAFGGQGTITNLTDTAEFSPQNQIYVSKNILVWATSPDETASLGEFTQRFSQQVPEPATALLFGLGLAGVGFARRRKN